MNKGLSYKNIFLIPNYSHLKSRADANTEIKIGKHVFKLPVIPSNMVSCIDFERAAKMAVDNYFYILHRFEDYDAVYNWLLTSNFYKSISIGIKKRDYDLIDKIFNNKINVNCVTVDVAHGDHSEVYKMLKFLKDYKTNINPDLFIIGGNIATPEAFCRMSYYCDAVKVGIAYGAACITYNKTGFASPMFSTIQQIYSSSCNTETRPLIIADGGISCNGDIPKALVAGADLVMSGSMFATCIDSPAMVDPTDPTKKLYFGSASKLNGNMKNVEGKTLSMPMNGMTYEQKLKELKQDLSSAISYAGGHDLTAFKDGVQYGIV